MKLFVVLCLFPLLFADMAWAQVRLCQEIFLKKISHRSNNAPDTLDIEDGSFLYLTTLLMTRMSFETVDHLGYRLKKMGREDLQGIRISDAEGRAIFVELLNFSYRSLTREELQLGHHLFRDRTPMDHKETLAKALIEASLAQKGSPGYMIRMKEALRIIGNPDSPQLMWHKAEMNARLEHFAGAQRLLVKIMTNIPQPPVKVGIALGLTQAQSGRNIPSRVLDKLDQSRAFRRGVYFDYSDWGPYY